MRDSGAIGRPAVYPSAGSAFSIRKTIRASLRSVISTLSPVSWIKLGISITESGSVQCTSSWSPAFRGLSALRVFSAGSGHLRPVRSSFVRVIQRPSHQAGIVQKADALAGLDLGDVFAQLDKPIGVDQRGQQPCPLARKL